MNLRRKMIFSELCPRLKLRFSCGSQSLKLKALAELMNLKETKENFSQELVRLRNQLKLSMLRSLEQKRANTEWRWNWRIWLWSMSAPMLQLSSLKKRTKNFEKVLGEWKVKADDLQSELEASQSECRNLNAETFRLKAGVEE